MSGHKQGNCSKVSATSASYQNTWLTWCRLCAKQGNIGQEHEIFSKNDTGQATALTTSIGKYFWVNIKVEDEISKSICKQCRILVEELCNFTERVNKVQTLFCLLQNLRPSCEEEANKLRSQCGLINERWEHIIKVPQPKPITANQEAQTDLVIFFNGDANRSSQESGDDNSEEIERLASEEQIEQEDEMVLMEMENTVEPNFECILPDAKYKSVAKTKRNDFGKSSSKPSRPVPKKIFMSNEKLEQEMELDEGAERDFEYLVNNDDDLVEIDESEFRQKTVNDDVDVQDSDLFKEFKYKADGEEGESEVNCGSNAVKENDSEYHEIQEIYSEGEVDDYVVLEEDEQECEVEKSIDEHSKSGDEKSTAVNACDLLVKRKRGRPPLSAKSGQRPSSAYRYQCKECKRKYKSANVYRKHMQVTHDVVIDNTTDFICSICQKNCHTKSRLQMHKRKHLPDDEKATVPCPYCDRGFSFVDAMRRHVKIVHQNIKPFICEQCGRTCKTLAALNEHLLVHTDECPFKCEVCGKSFKNNARLKSHMDTHNESEYACPECGLKLNTRRTLQQHRLVHTDVKRFKCEFCDAAFKRTKSLKNHLLLHSGLRPYKCPFCDKSFSNGSNCRSHKRRVHPAELAEEEALGKKSDPVPIPKLEDLKAAKTAVVQPRKVRRSAHGGKAVKRRNSDDSDDMDSFAMSEVHYEIKGELGEEGLDENHEDDGCEETVIYEIIDEI
uniref:Zinc finger protein weckle n=1 Tax=Stomoxys calcitrans TaxID=35570 RepID=A0A1I8PBE3_STOCA